MESKQLANTGEVKGAMTEQDIQARVNLIKKVMNTVMQKGQHYGVIPGCGDKPSLWKPGAEKIMSTFRIALDPVVEDLSTDDEARYRVTAKGVCQVTSNFLGAGVGECSSNESKYKWRFAICDDEYNGTPENRRREKYKKDYGKVIKVKQVRTDHADIANTILKMAKKRALVDMVLTVTAASDIFTQDIEDLPPEVLGNKATPQASKPPVKEPQAKKPEAEKPVWKPNQKNVSELAVGTVIPELRGTISGITAAKTPKDKKDITHYDIVLFGDNPIKISVWGTVHKDAGAGMTLVAINTNVREYKNQRQYVAEEIMIEG